MIFFLIPVYNEDLNIFELAGSLKSSGMKAKYVFVDDGSTDNTVAEIKKSFEGFDFFIIQNKINCGPGFSFNEGFEWILKNNSSPDDLVITLEGDNTSDLSIIPEMIKLAESGHDLVLASVYMKGGSISEYNTLKVFLSGIANRLTRIVFSLEVKTLTSFYRVYKVNLLKKIKAEYGTLINEKGFICKVELLLKAKKCDAKIIEFPTVLQSHLRKGKTKMKIVKTGLNYLLFILKNFYKY
ncbi:MAG: glycosyltransferase [Bacteroidia bacterium]